MGQDVNWSSWIEASYSAVTWCYKTETWFTFAPPSVELQLYRVYLNAWTNFRSEFFTPQQKNVCINRCLKTLGFQGTATMFSWLQSFRFLPVGTSKNCDVFSSNWKQSDTSQQCIFWCLSNHMQPPQNLWKHASVYDQTCPCVHWFRCRTFWAFAVNCDVIHNKNSAVY
jgi:hypothetical protein